MCEEIIQAKSPKCRIIMDLDIRAIEENDTWDLANTDPISYLYVDDLIFTRNDKTIFTKFKKSMMDAFNMINVGKIRHFHGIEVIQRSNGIFIQ